MQHHLEDTIWEHWEVVFAFQYQDLVASCNGVWNINGLNTIDARTQTRGELNAVAVTQYNRN